MQASASNEQRQWGLYLPPWVAVAGRQASKQAGHLALLSELQQTPMQYDSPVYVQQINTAQPLREQTWLLFFSPILRSADLP